MANQEIPVAPSPKAQAEAAKFVEAVQEKKKELAEEKAEAKLESEAVPVSEEEESAQALQTLEQRKARIAQMLTRGTMNDRLADIDCPPDRRPVWVRETPEDIARYQGLGYQVEKEFGRKFVDHDRGDNVARMGDVILMTIPMDEYNLIQEVEEELKQKKRDAPKEEYLAKAAQVPDVPIIKG